jgi:DNA-binding CsgD family transcriptional regulator
MEQAIVGREDELEEIVGFLAAVGSNAAGLVLEGEAGAGKTTLLKAALDAARVSGFSVLGARPAETEASLPYSALADLLDGVPENRLKEIPAPQRQALDIALLRREAEASGTDRLAVARGALNVLRALAQRGPVALAIDDVQWLDVPTRRALEFIVRRSEGVPLVFIVSLRGSTAQGVPLGLDEALALHRLLVVEAGPLSIESVDEIVRQRLGAQLSRPTLRKVHRTSGGNPFFALELARALLRSADDGGSALPVAPTLAELLRARIGAVGPAARSLLEIAAACAQPTPELLAAAGADQQALDETISADVLRWEGTRIRFSHPLLASIVYADMSIERRRDVHSALAGASDDLEERAVHVALAAERPDETIATQVADAAARAAARGAPDAAAELAEYAAALTPESAGETAALRLVEAARFQLAAGDRTRARVVLERVVETTPPGSARAEALCELSRAREDDLSKAAALCDQALGEAGDDARLRATIHQRLASISLIRGHLPASAAHARSAVEFAERAGDERMLAMALSDVGYAETLMGLGIPMHHLERALALERANEPFPVFFRPSFELGLMRMWTDDLEAARPLMLEELERATNRGDERARALVLFHLAELECRSGQWPTAAQYAYESASLARQASHEQDWGSSLFAQALVDAYLGNVEAARAAAERGLQLAEGVGDAVFTIQNRGVLGFLELSLGDPISAHAHLEPAMSLLRATQIREFSIFPVMQNEIEALVALGEVDEADALVRIVADHGRRKGRRWAQAIAARGHALVLAARGDLEGAADAIGQALVAHEQLADPFERGRSLLVKGAVERRVRRRGAARTSLDEALRIFDRLGARLWSEKARADLARLGLRSAPTALSATEARIAQLAAAGHLNKEIAQELFVTVKTVEANLSRVYRKLGIRSRTELARRLQT